jgi:hypothetical protein
LEIYYICNFYFCFLAAPISRNPYISVNYNKSKIHPYHDSSDIPIHSHLSTNNDTNKTNPIFSVSLANSFQTSITRIPSLSSSSSRQHFDSVLVAVSVHQMLLITDMQAGALLGLKGERIQQLQLETWVIVNIGDVNDDNGERRKRIISIDGIGLDF